MESTNTVRGLFLTEFRNIQPRLCFRVKALGDELAKYFDKQLSRLLGAVDLEKVR